MNEKVEKNILYANAHKHNILKAKGSMSKIHRLVVRTVLNLKEEGKQITPEEVKYRMGVYTGELPAGYKTFIKKLAKELK